jgi:hypothetical protein
MNPWYKVVIEISKALLQGTSLEFQVSDYFDQGNVIDSGVLTCYSVFRHALGISSKSRYKINWKPERSREFRLAIAKTLAEDKFEPMIEMLENKRT